MATDALLFKLKDQLITAKLAVLAVQEATAQEVKFMEGSLQDRQLELWLLLRDNLSHLESFTREAVNEIEAAVKETIARRSSPAKLT